LTVPKKEKKGHKKRESKKEAPQLEGVNIEEIPPDVLEQLKERDHEKSNSDEETNSFLEKIDKYSEEETIRSSKNSNNSKKDKKNN